MCLDLAAAADCELRRRVCGTAMSPWEGEEEEGKEGGRINKGEEVRGEGEGV